MVETITEMNIANSNGVYALIEDNKNGTECHITTYLSLMQYPALWPYYKHRLTEKTDTSWEFLLLI